MSEKSSNKRKKKNYNRFQYTTETLQNAIEEVKNKRMSLNRASLQFKVPKSTLFSYLHKAVPIERKMGPLPVLFPSEELRIKKWILAKAKLGFPMHPVEVKIAVQKVLKATGRPNPFEDDLPGRKWFKLFLKRHPEIILTHTQVISKARAAVTEEGLRNWFKMIKEYLKEESAEEIFENPSRVYNLDEIGMQTCPRTGKVLGQKGEKNHYSISPGPEKQSITVLCCFAASGEGVDPLIVYPYQRIPRDVMEKVPDNIAVGKSPTGWMISATFYEYMANIFYKRLVEKKVTFPVILFLDGHKSHISMELHEFCVEKKILLVCLPPNATHIMQPCDVGIFRPLKIEWRKVIQQHQQSTTKPITKINFAPLFATAYEKAMKVEIVQKAFKCCGLYPLNPDNLNYSKCISTRRKELFNLESPDNIALNSVNKSIFDLESHLPPDVKKMFLEAYESKVEPTTEKVLFSIWKKYKESSLSLAQEVEMENSASNENSGSSSKENNSINLEVSSISSNDNCISLHQCEDSGFSTESHFESSDYPSELLDVPIELDDTLLSQDDIPLDAVILPSKGSNIQINVPVIDISNYQEEISKDSVISIPDNDKVQSNVDIIVVEAVDDKTKSTCSSTTSEEILTCKPLDLSQKTFLDSTAQGSMCSIENKSTRKVLDVQDNKYDFSGTPSFTGKISPDCNKLSSLVYVKEKENIDMIWKQHLHYPKIEKGQNPKKCVDTIYAITSKQWKEKEDEKRKIAEQEQLEKEKRKEERILKRKIKQEAIEEKRIKKENQKKAAPKQKENKKKRNFNKKN